MEAQGIPLGKLKTPMPSHPLEEAESKFGERQEYLRMEAARNTFGAFLPLSMAMERAAAAKVQRLPPLLSSNFSYEILTGEAYCIDVHHVFNTVSEQTLDGHKCMEQRLKLK